MDIWKEEEQGLALRQGLEFPASETPGWASLFLCPCAGTQLSLHALGRVHRSINRRVEVTWETSLLRSMEAGEVVLGRAGEAGVGEAAT